MFEFAGILRKTEFSPKHEANDLLIMEKVRLALEKSGNRVKFYNEANLQSIEIKERLIFSMVQGPAGTGIMKAVENSGALVINSPMAVENCYRYRMTDVLAKAGIPFPMSKMVNTYEALDGSLSPFKSDYIWLKRNDVHAVESSDVVRVKNSKTEVSAQMEKFFDRNIKKVVLQEEISGDVIKFYGVRETPFFYWYYTLNEDKNLFNQKDLIDEAMASAETTGLYVYGGDAIISKDGRVTIIDINDWPSFAPIRDEASENISKLLLRKAQNYVKS